MGWRREWPSLLPLSLCPLALFQSWVGCPELHPRCRASQRFQPRGGRDKEWSLVIDKYKVSGKKCQKKMRTKNTKPKTSPLSGPIGEELCSRWCQGIKAIPDNNTQLSGLHSTDAIENQGSYCQTKRGSKLEVVQCEQMDFGTHW